MNEHHEHVAVVYLLKKCRQISTLLSFWYIIYEPQGHARAVSRKN